MKISLLHTINGRFWTALLAGVVTVVLFISVSATDIRAAQGSQTRFPSPDEAVQALVAAARADDLKTMQAILGPGSKDVISSGDSVADNAGRDKFVASYEQRHSLEARTAGTMILHIGADDWSMPIPIVKKGKNWGFDIGKGKRKKS